MMLIFCAMFFLRNPLMTGLLSIWRLFFFCYFPIMMLITCMTLIQQSRVYSKQLESDKISSNFVSLSNASNSPLVKRDSNWVNWWQILKKHVKNYQKMVLTQNFQNVKCFTYSGHLLICANYPSVSLSFSNKGGHSR